MVPSLYLFNSPSVQELWPWQKHHSTSCHPTLQQISRQRYSPGAKMAGMGRHPTASSPKTQHLYFYMIYALFLLVKQNKGFLSFQSNKREAKIEKDTSNVFEMIRSFNPFLVKKFATKPNSHVSFILDFERFL